MKKSKFILGITLSILFCVPVSAAVTYKLTQVDYPIIVNGNNLDTSDNLPVLNYNGSTYLPLRKVAEAVGADIKWNDADKTVVINSTKNTIVANTSSLGKYGTLELFYNKDNGKYTIFDLNKDVTGIILSIDKDNAMISSYDKSNFSSSYLMKPELTSNN